MHPSSYVHVLLDDLVMLKGSIAICRVSQWLPVLWLMVDVGRREPFRDCCVMNSSLLVERKGAEEAAVRPMFGSEV